MMNTKYLALAAISLVFVHSLFAQQKSAFVITDTFHIASAGGWDYIAVGPDKNLYVSHNTQVNILSKETGDSVGVIPNTPGVHGIAFDVAANKGFTSNGKVNTVTVFNIETRAILAQIPVGKNPDAILYEAFSKKIITCNGQSNDLTIIDPDTYKIIATIPVGGKPETAVFDSAGKLYVNIEDKNEIVVVDIKNFKVLQHWSVSPGEGPTGLAIDNKLKRLFVGCEKLLMVLNAENGKLIAKIPIGDGCDGVAFDNTTKEIFTANGEGSLSIIHEKNKEDFELILNLLTKKSARTIALDEETHTVYLPAAELESALGGQRPKMKPGTFQILVIKNAK